MPVNGVFLSACCRWIRGGIRCSCGPRKSSCRWIQIGTSPLTSFLIFPLKKADNGVRLLAGQCHFDLGVVFNSSSRPLCDAASWFSFTRHLRRLQDRGTGGANSDLTRDRLGLKYSGRCRVVVEGSRCSPGQPCAVATLRLHSERSPAIISRAIPVIHEPAEGERSPSSDAATRKKF